MRYVNTPDLNYLTEQLLEYTRLKQEYGALEVEKYMEKAEVELQKILEELKGCPIDTRLEYLEPNDVQSIRNLRPQGPRRIWNELPTEEYQDKLSGAFLARMAGCTLGAPVEFYSIKHMENWAKYIEMEFPPTDYWKMVKYPFDLRYEKSDYTAYTKNGINKVPVDDDITYTLLGLYLVEEWGLNFATEDVGKAWIKYLPYACTDRTSTRLNSSHIQKYRLPSSA